MSFVTPQVPQFALDNIAWLNQERRRRENEEAEVELRSKELTIRRCQVDLGIVNSKILKDIAEQVFRAEVQDRQQTAALNIYQREVERLRGGDGLPTSPPRILTSPQIRDIEDEVEVAQQTLNTQRDIRNARLRSYLNVCRTESTRDEGKATLEKLATGLAEAFAKDPNYDPRGRPVHCRFDFTRIGQAEDYLTLHNRDYERGPASELAPNFRNIKIKGKTLAIRALKNTHANEYAVLMENPEWSKPEPGLVVPGVAPRRQRVVQRIRELAGDAGHGQGYALAVQGHGDGGQFYGIASYNRIVTTTPNDFFETVHMSPDKHRMVDFNFQLSCASLSMQNAIEVGILIIEHARRYFGASLFLTQCSPLNSRYIDIMGALGLGRYQTIEAASYDRKLTAMVWKFDLCAWKAAEVELRFRGEWFINDDTMQEDPDRLKRPIKSEPREDFPNLAKVKTRATALEDPAAFENRSPPRQPVVRLFPHPVEGVQATEHTAWSSSESQTNQSNSTGTIESGDSGTSSGLGHSESAQSQLTFDTFRTHSLPDSTSRSSDATSQSGTGVFGLQGANFASSSAQSGSQDWEISEVVTALREEASRAMPPPMLPIRPPVNEQDMTESDLLSMAHYSDATSESLGIDSQSSVPDDPKGKRPAYAYSLSHPGPSMEQSQVRGQQVEHLAPEAWSLNNTGLEATPAPTALYDRKGKRPASVSWEAQVNKRPPSSRPQINDEDIYHAPPSGTGPANHQDQPKLPQARKHHEDSAASVQKLSGCTAPNYGQSDTDHYDRSNLAIGPTLGHSETVSPNLQSSMALQEPHNVTSANESILSPSPVSNSSRIDASRHYQHSHR
ncbi:hypothetical protein NLG97_g1147 [Lecanicillium saksenae]|uniref:Uncharacterized protein n=1 Tax=Lecanicillium saksenae TaxID=468837 RepID=A0ACC1R7U8_9HYPO|nr:hypothetical protein NLG97_g1147 [Lecanicillium saksenae]